MVQQPPVVWNPYSKGYFENPYPHLKLCRQNSPIQKGIIDSWMFFRYSDVHKFLRSGDFLVSDLSQFFTDKEEIIFKNTTECPYLARATKQWPMYLNGDYHKKIRVVIGKALNEFDIENIILEAIEHTNGVYKSQQSFDLVSYCSTFIFDITQKLMGISNHESLEKFVKYSNLLAISQDLFVPRQVYQEINANLLWGRDIFPDSQFKELMKSNLEKMEMESSEDDLYSLLSISAMAAFETSKDNLSCTLFEVLKDNSLIDYIVDADKAGLDLFIEEILRYSSPLQFTIRVNKEPLEIDEISIPANSKLFLSIASANRDESVFENPDQIIPNRKANEHLSFGGGVHFCLGASIARLEMRHCLKPMVAFLKDYLIVEKDIHKSKFAKQIFMRTMESAMLERKV